ncbi:XRE family transcriptional regulator [Neobacillus notoginsengisoli]|uniref:XRE family transcriptional regulator n=1 Tax=Neobacillus notoginsengisoli TaxID=1578198 RepID=A0A417YXQ9_9BACI|nr:helix-turn-helix transcriptional regulator [Neobacillus notoginsengisoli]RHW42539.1 XRE family transcriptional regulator [Neobacillus notoginsengisoli]
MEGRRIRKLRTEKGMSLNKLSELTGISKSYLSFLERGIQRNPSIDVLEKLAAALQVSVDVFINKEKDAKAVNGGTGILKLHVELSEKDMEPEKIKRVKELLEILNEPGSNGPSK